MRADSSHTDLVVPRNNVLIEFNDSKFTLYVVLCAPHLFSVSGKSHSFAFERAGGTASFARAGTFVKVI